MSGKRHEMEFARHGIIGKSPAWLAQMEKIKDYAESDQTVLITGASGTGKEVCARAIHYTSSRSAMPFVPFNCARPADLMENELFGHAVGAFTSANKATEGLFASAAGGTLFLDEIEELLPPAQAKFLRVLEDKTVCALGSQKSRRLDVRLIAATNMDVRKALETGKLRRDFYYRLNVIRLELPPLRERPGDVALLALFFLRECRNWHSEAIQGFTTAALKKLECHDWPGNVRELANTVQRAAFPCRKSMLDASDITFETTMPAKNLGSFKLEKARVVAEWEARQLKDYLQLSNGNVTHAAEKARMARSAFWRLLQKHQIGSRAQE